MIADLFQFIFVRRDGGLVIDRVSSEAVAQLPVPGERSRVHDNEPLRRLSEPL